MNWTGASSASFSAGRVLVLAGTTASGKTEVSLPLAERLGGVILNADSRQVYRELSIGTARPTPEQLARVPHEFVGVRSIHERWTAGDFARACREKIEAHLAAGRTPVVVGGSMLYLRALLQGFYEGEAEPHLDYAELRREWERRGGAELYDELSRVDPGLAARTKPEDQHRILRGLGVYRATGRRLTDLREGVARGLAREFSLYFLYGDRAQTYARVNRRVDEMLEQGLVEEVRGLMIAGVDERNCNALRTHGYQEVFPYLRGETDFETMREQIRQAVRRYVKRQLTWFRAEPRAIWVRRSFDEDAGAIAERIARDFLGEQQLEQDKTR